ncbi:hypothetical protein BELL_0258g00120 [Botrytis elliptica]|uniref:Uncharacterized protein n=1 Tax=Botrytis elliptica TaxID=278938 RepID=A0A4Z1K0A7_9HELO|nr:hypothetical protein BELL_0258g00120 [Botrytis elliptica]
MPTDDETLEEKRRKETNRKQCFRVEQAARETPEEKEKRMNESNRKEAERRKARGPEANKRIDRRKNLRAREREKNKLEEKNKKAAERYEIYNSSELLTSDNRSVGPARPEGPTYSDPPRQDHNATFAMTSMRSSLPPTISTQLATSHHHSSSMSDPQHSVHTSYHHSSSMDNSEYSLYPSYQKPIANSRSDLYSTSYHNSGPRMNNNDNNPSLLARDHSKAMELFHNEEFSNLVEMPIHHPANPVVYENTGFAVSFPTNEGKSCLPATDFGVAPSRHENHYLAPDGSESRDNHASPTIDSRSASPKNKSYSQETSRYNPAESGRHHSTGSGRHHSTGSGRHHSTGSGRHHSTGSGRHTSRHHTPPATVSDPAPPAQGYNYPVNTTSYASGEPIEEYVNANDEELSVPNSVFHDPQQYNPSQQ